MIHTRRSLVAVSVVAASLFALAAPARAQVAVVTVRSLSALQADFRYLAPLVKSEAQVAELDAFLNKHPRLKALEGADGNEPFGLYVNWPEKKEDVDQFNFPVVFFLPVTDEKKFLGVCEELGFTPKPAQDGLYQLTVFGFPQRYLRFAHGHAYLAKNTEWLLGTLPKPADILPIGARDNLLVASLRVEHFPPAAARHLAGLYDTLQKQINQELGEDDRRPGESETEYRRRRLARRNADNFSTGMLHATGELGKQLREVTLRAAVDRKEQTVAVELAIVPQAGSQLAGLASHIGGARSRFSALTRTAPAGAFLHIPGPKGGDSVPDLEPIQKAVRELVGSRNRDLIVKFMQILIPTIGADGLDCFVTVTPLSGPHFDLTILAGLKVRNGRKLDYLLRDTYRDFATNDKKGIAVEWNHAAHAGARIHRARFGESEEDIFVAIREDAVFVAAGTRALPVLRKGLDDFDRANPVPTPLLEVTAMSALVRQEESFHQAIEKVVPAALRDKLFARLTVRGKDDLRLRVEASAYILRVLSEIGDKE